MSNSRFTVAVHVLCLLAKGGGDQLLTSENMAKSVNTNAVVIRRILASLRKAGLVISSTGPAGGWLLAKSPEKIRLSEVLTAIELKPVFAMHSQVPNQRCEIGKNVQRALMPIYKQADLAIVSTFEEISIDDVLKTTIKRN